MEETGRSGRDIYSASSDEAGCDGAAVRVLGGRWPTMMEATVMVEGQGQGSRLLLVEGGVDGVRRIARTSIGGPMLLVPGVVQDALFPLLRLCPPVALSIPPRVGGCTCRRSG